MSPKKNFFSTTAGKVTFCIGGLLFSLCFLLLTTDIQLAGLFPSRATLEKAREECEEAEKERAEAETKWKEFTRVEEEFRKLRDSGWIESRDGTPTSNCAKRLKAPPEKRGLT